MIEIDNPPGALPLDPAKGSKTLWTPFLAMRLSDSFQVERA